MRKKKTEEIESSHDEKPKEKMKSKKSKSKPKSKKSVKKSSKALKKKPIKKSKKSSKKSTKKIKKSSKKSTKKSKADDKKMDKLPSSVLDLPLTPLDENLQKLLTEEEREKMEENLDLVVCYLEDIGIVDLKIDRKKLIIAVPFDYEDFTFLSHIVLSPEWILIKTSIFEIEKLTQTSIMHLYSEILKGNFILNSVVYSLDPENKSIWAQADVPISADFDTFKLNYFSIVFAIDYFMKNISPKLQMQLKSTVEKETFKNTEDNLYI